MLLPGKESLDVLHMAKRSHNQGEMQDISPPKRWTPKEKWEEMPDEFLLFQKSPKDRHP